MSINKKNKLVVIIMGAPGAGKGTQAELLSERLGLYYLETSKMLEEKFKQAEKGYSVEVKEKIYRISDEENLWKEGKLCSPPFVTYLIKAKIKKLFEEGRNPLLAGSPRTLYEGKELVPFLKELYGAENIRVVLLDIKPEETIFRNSHRRICELMRHPILYSEETKNLVVCPLDGSKLLRRKGLDDPETIKVRLEEYKNRTFPLIDYFEKQGLKVEKINGSPSPAVVFGNVLKAVE